MYSYDDRIRAIVAQRGGAPAGRQQECGPVERGFWMQWSGSGSRPRQPSVFGRERLGKTSTPMGTPSFTARDIVSNLRLSPILIAPGSCVEFHIDLTRLFAVA